MLPRRPAGERIDRSSAVAVSGTQARAFALLPAVLLLALPSAVRAQDDVVSAATASAVIASLPHDFSPWSMFVNADIVVKATMVGLAFASLITWTVWLAKGLELSTARRRASGAMRSLTARRASTRRRGRSRPAPPARGAGDLVRAALLEMRRSEGLSQMASRSASPSRCRASRRAPAARWEEAQDCWRRSAQRPHSSDCSALSGAS